MNMQVAKNTVVTLDYSVTDVDGELVDAGQEPLVYLHGGYDDIFPMIEEAMHGKKIGESVTIKMQPDDAFGEYDAALVQLEPRSQFPQELQVGIKLDLQCYLRGNMRQQRCTLMGIIRLTANGMTPSDLVRKHTDPTSQPQQSSSSGHKSRLPVWPLRTGTGKFAECLARAPSKTAKLLHRKQAAN